LLPAAHASIGSSTHWREFMAANKPNMEKALQMLQDGGRKN
jgi:hypothetical protein